MLRRDSGIQSERAPFDPFPIYQGFLAIKRMDKRHMYFLVKAFVYINLFGSAQAEERGRNRKTERKN